MSRDVTLDDHHPWEREPVEPHNPDFDGVYQRSESILDRDIILPASLWRWLAVSVAFVGAFLLRFLGLDRWPLSVEGSNIALAAHRLVRGESVPDHLLGAPFAVEWTALFFFAGGSAESVARIAHAVAGLVLVAVLFGLAPWLGARTAIAAALVAAFSPTLIASARQIDGGALLTALTALVILSAVKARSEGGSGWAAAAGVVTALLIVSGPLGAPAALLGWLAVVLLGRDQQHTSDRESVIGAILAGLATYVLSTTALLTKPASFTATTGELIERLYDENLSDIGSRFYMPAFNVILNEPILLLFAIVAAVASTRRDLVRALAIWFGAALLLVSLISADSPAGYAIVVLPLVVLAAVGVVHVVERLPWSRVRGGPALLYMLAVLLMAAAVVSLIGLVTGGVGDDTVEWLLRFALVVLVAILPLSIAITAIGRRVAGDRLVLVLAGGVLLLSALTLRSAVMTASQWPDQPGNPLSTGVTGADIPLVVGRVERLSRDLTMGIRDAQDPTGGHGLRIALDEEIEQPFRWYFRDFPNVTVFDPDASAPPLDAQIVLLDGEREIETVAPGFSGQSYLYARGEPEIYRSPDWSNLITSLVNPDDWRRFIDFLITRQPAVAAPEQEFQLAAAPDIAQRLFPAQGPFGLQDRSGAGSGQGQLNRPRGIAVGPDGSIYVVDSRNARIQKYAPTGEFLLAFGGEGSAPGQFGRIDAAGGGGPSGITMGSDGNLYVADTWNHRIQVFTPDGEYLRGWGQFFDAQDNPDPSLSTGMFYGPRGITANDGLIYVTDTGNERVQVFEESGTFVRAFGGTGSDDERLLEPVGIAVTSDGTVMVADSHNARIARFTTDGEWLDPWRIEQWQGLRFFEPYLALGSDGILYATTSVTGTVIPISASGTPEAEIGDGQLRQPFGVTVEPGGGALLVTDGLLHTVVRLPLAP